MWILYCLVLCSTIIPADSCTWFSYHWVSWSSCSKSCGGGTRTRHEESCVHHDRGDTQHEDCNEVCSHGHSFSSGRCHCPPWRWGYCCDTCRHISITHCKSGRQQCGGIPDNIRCTECSDPYYSGGYGNGCRECKQIANCQHRHCTQYSNTTCIKCDDDNFFFGRREADTKCERLCAWNNHFCWPGVCGDSLTKNCICSDGFKLVSNSGETSCQPIKSPSIEKCGTTFSGAMGEKKQSQSSSNSTACQFYQDVYGNFQLTNVEYQLTTEYTIEKPNITKQTHIKEFNFGITDATIHFEKNALSGTQTDVGTLKVLEDISHSMLAKNTYYNRGNISMTSYSLQNGEWLCIRYETLGGGYLKGIDMSKSTHVELGPTPYRKNKATKKICYHYDNASPIHCKAAKNCSTDPLHIQDKVTRSRTVPVDFHGWFDPTPNTADPSRASSIESFEISVHETILSKTQVKIGLGNIYKTKVNSSVTSVILNLPPDSPRLYCVKLEVKDVADNVRQARRFVLYDNTSFIETRPENPIYVKSASPDTNYQWQTHHNDLCVDWKHHFFNILYPEDSPLNPIELDHHGLISGVYDQIEGILPITGTENVDGIISFKYTWNLNNSTMTKDVTVPNFLNQSYCKQFDLKDGQTYTFKVRAIDIVDNKLEDETTVHIDRTVPHIKSMWLQKDSYKGLFVHDSKELSTMSLYFEALDPHSGILNVHWALGTADSGVELLTEVLTPQLLNVSTCPDKSATCYCPDVGKCEISSYRIPLNKLVKVNKNLGNHNRNYYFSVKATNNALLSNIEHVEILVDDSPPEPGAVFEGPEGSPDIDYTSDTTVMVNWHGFIDHESGIKVYRIGIARRCLHNNELMVDQNNQTEEISDSAEVPFMIQNVKLAINDTGKFFVTVIAVNNAMEPSESVCSDGVTRDISPPTVRNLTMQHAGWSESIGCMDGTPWLIDASLRKISLQPTTTCVSKCLNATEAHILHSIPEKHSDHQDTDIADFLCQTLPPFTEGNFIYMPDDYLLMEWTTVDNESQLNDFHVGFGRDASEKSAPSLIGYTSTNKNTYFKRHHDGFGSDTIFYIFLKAVSKSGLSDVVTIGPVIIDVTPPRNNEVPTVAVSNDIIKVSWENDTFYDEEQVSPIRHIMFQFASDEGSLTPLHEWRLETSTECGHCIRYPLEKLQVQDNDKGHEFFVKLFVYNTAGHFSEVRSDTFRLPSKYPPGKALVYDINPGSVGSDDAPEDIDLHHTPNILCAKWDGFKHHENVSIEIGVGLDSENDTIVKFRKTNNINKECINSTAIQFDTKYYVLLRASCSGGETISSSDGVRLINITKVLNKLKVKFGKSCHNESIIYNSTINLNNFTTNLGLDYPLHVGKDYGVFVSDGKWRELNANYLDIKSDDVVKVNISDNKYMSFVPFIEEPTLVLNMNKYLMSLNISIIRLSLVECRDDITFVTTSEPIYVTLHFGEVLSLAFKYQVRLITVSDRSNAVVSRIGTMSSKETTGKYTISLGHLRLNASERYRAEVKICGQNKCTGSTFSKELNVVETHPSGVIEEARSKTGREGNCTEVKINWKDFLDKSGMMFYTWSLSLDAESSRLLKNWSVILDTMKTEYEVHACLQLPVYDASTMFVCIRGYSNARTMRQICRKLDYVGHGTITDFDQIYDFETSAMSWETIKTVIHSNRIGDKMSVLHDHELNIGPVNTVVGGAVMYATERTVSWYLMTAPYIPVSCKSEVKCIEEISTDVGYVIFSQENIQHNAVYYTCARSNQTVVNREFHTEVLPELASCSNGFEIDDTPPRSGQVTVESQNGYLVKRDLDISWTGFTDNVDATMFGFPRNVAYYQLKVGNSPGSDSIVNAINTSDRTHHTKELDVKDGTLLYVSVTAFDFSGQNTTVYSSLYTMDTSPPRVGDVVLVNDIVDQLYTSSIRVDLHLTNFNDPDSGINHFEISIGSSQNNDSLSIQTAKKNTVFKTNDIRLNLDGYNLVDGHNYYIGVVAVNRAGLKSETTSVPIIIDRSPPEAGHVMDGHWSLKKDLDFQHTIGQIEGHWTGFIDQESGLSYYRVGLGTRPYVDDVRPIADIGLVESISWSGSFIVGQKYYIIVEACNGADLCRQTSSDGIILDNSPPIRGLVRVGPDSRHQTYLPRNSSVRIQWTGFEDPHSGIERFEACIGENPFTCDILPYFSCLLSSSIIKSSLNLPLGQRMYATVIAFNNAGMNVTQSSDSFLVDDTAPKMLTKPSFLLDYNAVGGLAVQWERSVLRIYWEFDDIESPIVRHEISLQTHHEGHTPVERVEVANVNKVTINVPGNKWLHNGDTYSALVTCCNAAGHCRTERSRDLLIDSTPPFLGGFKPPMAWENGVTTDGDIRSKLKLTWYGFQDEESSIESYFITARRSMSDLELTNGTIHIPVNHSMDEMTAQVNLNDGLNADDVVVLAIWARNKAGLNSTIGRISVNAILTAKATTNRSTIKGTLEIQKHSCDVQFCNKDCTCAVVGQPCVDVGTTKPCQPLNTTFIDESTTYDRISVSGGLENANQNMTASSACLSGHWKSISENLTQKVVRYEWSAGLANQPIGEGVFDLKSERPWHDVGLHEQFIHCLPINRSLIHGEKYVIYVRAWYDFEVYMEYSSTPIHVDHTSPAVRRGGFVKDSDTSCMKDFDFIDLTSAITSCWNGVFNELQGRIIHYTVSLGTSPKADDVLAASNVGLNTSFTVSTDKLTHGTSYYFTVTAYNDVGIHTTSTSDGFIVDVANPRRGIVFNTKFHRNEQFQNTQDSFSISWHGFEDHCSGIRSYIAALIEETTDDTTNVTFTNVGLQTSYTFSNIRLTPGMSYIGVVKAIDAAGHSSREARSAGKTVDITPPYGYTCIEYELLEYINQTILHETSKNFTFYQNFTKDTLYVIRSSLRTVDKHVSTLFILDRYIMKLPIASNHDGWRQVEYSFFYPLLDSKSISLKFESQEPINGTASISRCIKMVRNATEAVAAKQIGTNAISVNVLVRDEESSVHKVRVGAGSTKGGFQIHPLSPVRGGNNGIINVDVPHATPVHVTAIVENYSGLRSVFHAHPLIIDHTAPEIYDVKVKTDIVNDTGIGLRSVVTTEWKLREDESDIKACYCNAGTSRFSSNLIGMWKSDNVQSCKSNSVDIQHGSTIYVTVTCVNSVELMTETVANPVDIVLKPPTTDSVKVSFVQLNAEFSVLQEVGKTGSTYIQTNDSHIQMQWSGFSDTLLLRHYEYRLLSGASAMVDWTNSGKKSMAVVSGFPFASGITYTAEIRAFNNFYSEAVQASLLIFKDSPKLTGTPANINRSNRRLTIDWSGVFETFESHGMTVQYSLTIGSRSGFNDVTEEQGITDRSRSITVPTSTIVTVEVKELFITIVCYLSNGLNNLYEANYKF